MNELEQSTRLNPSWLGSFLDYTQGIPSPEIFRKWAGISTIAGALGRKVKIPLAGGDLYPNMFVLLVAPPGVGKSQAINHTFDLWRELPNAKVAPTSITHKGLIDHLASGECKVVHNVNGVDEVQHSTLIADSEFGVRLPSQ